MTKECKVWTNIISSIVKVLCLSSPSLYFSSVSLFISFLFSFDLCMNIISSFLENTLVYFNFIFLKVEKK